MQIGFVLKDRSRRYEQGVEKKNFCKLRLLLKCCLRRRNVPLLTQILA